MLSDFQTGEPLALLEGSYLTMIRTGALSGVATKYLARHNAKTLCIIGTGEQAKGIAEAIFAVRDIEKVILYNRTEEKAYAFAQYIQENLVNLLTFTRIQMKQYVKQRSSSQLRTQPHQSSQKSCKRRPRKRRRLIQTEHARTTLTCHS